MMKNFKVYGSGCANCVRTKDLIEQVAAELGEAINVEKVTDMRAIVQAGILRTPGVSLNEALVHSGSVPDIDSVRSWFR